VQIEIVIVKEGRERERRDVSCLGGKSRDVRRLGLRRVFFLTVYGVPPTWRRGGAEIKAQLSNLYAGIVGHLQMVNYILSYAAI
jgi:hypothetical protein